MTCPRCRSTLEVKWDAPGIRWTRCAACDGGLQPGAFTRAVHAVWRAIGLLLSLGRR